MNKLSDFLINTRVTYTYKDGSTELGTVVDFWGENIRVQWDGEHKGNLFDHHYNSPCIALAYEEINEVKLMEPTEDRIKNLIVHLITVNENDRACEVIEVLRNYINEQILKKYELK